MPRYINSILTPDGPSVLYAHVEDNLYFLERGLSLSEYPHKFTSKLKSQSTVEHQKVEFEVTVEAEDADVSWFIGGKKVNPDDKRFQVVVKGTVRKLIIKDTLLADAGEITAKTNVDSTSGKLRVARESFICARSSNLHER